jgi:hypothetical protein
VRVTRRGFLGTVGVVAGIAAGTGLYTWQVEPNWLVVVQRQLPVRALPARLVGRTLVQISDTHVGPSVEAATWSTCFDRLRRCGPTSW